MALGATRVVLETANRRIQFLRAALQLRLMMGPTIRQTLVHGTGNDTPCSVAVERGDEILKSNCSHSFVYVKFICCYCYSCRVATARLPPSRFAFVGDSHP